MLVLTRKTGEKIRIGDDVVLTVVFVRDGKVRLGIDARPNVRVVRSEIAHKQPGGSHETDEG